MTGYRLTGEHRYRHGKTGFFGKPVLILQVKVETAPTEGYMQPAEGSIDECWIPAQSSRFTWIDATVEHLSTLFIRGFDLRPLQ